MIKDKDSQIDCDEQMDRQINFVDFCLWNLQ